MENYGIFGQLAVESREENVGETNVVEEIAAEEAYADALAIESEIVAGVAAMSQAQVAADRVEAQISHESMLLANPEQINVGCVALSQESLATTALLLGADASILAPAVSQEAAEANPVSAMQIAKEEKDNFLDKVIKSIKAIFNKVMNAAKKLYVKLVVAMDGTAKKAQKLKKHIEKDIEDSDRTKDKLSEKDSEKLHKMIPVRYMDPMFKKAKGVDVGTLEEVSMYLTNDISDNIKSVGNDKVSTEGGGRELQDELKKAIGKEEMSRVENAKKIIAKTTNSIDIDLAEKLTNYTPHGDDPELHMLTVGTKKLTCIEFFTKDNDGDKSYRCKITTLTPDLSSINDKQEVVMPKDVMLGELKTCIEIAKDFPKTKNGVLKAIDRLDKRLDKLAKSNTSNVFSYALNKVKAGDATFLRDMTVSVLLNMVLDVVKSAKAGIYGVNISLGMYNNSASDM